MPTFRRAPLTAVLAAAALAAGLVSPVLAEEDPAAELERTAADRDEAADALAALEGRLDAVEVEVAAADLQLAVLADELAVVEQRLAAATAAATAAEQVLAGARERLATADATLSSADGAFRDARTALDDRVARVWMHGPGGDAARLLSGIGQVTDLHDVAVVARATEQVLDDDRRLLDAAVDGAGDAAAARAELADRRAALTAVAAAAHEARAVTEGLVDTHRGLVARAEQHRAGRAAALARIERDTTARAALVDRLDARVEELRDELLADWLREVRQVPVDGPPPPWANGLPTAGEAIAPAIEAAAAAAGIDGRLFAALVWTESSFRPGARSPAGAIGLAQLMPSTAAELGVDPTDPIANLHGGARYLRIQLDRFDRVDLALAAYNAGPGRVARAGNAVPDIVETQLYVLRILDRYDRLG